MIKILKVSAAAMVLGLAMQSPAHAELRADFDAYVKCKDGYRVGYQLNGLPNYTAAAQNCQDLHGGLDDGPAITNHGLTATFAEPRNTQGRPLLQPTPLDAPIRGALTTISKDAVAVKHLSELVAANNANGIRELLASRGGFRGGIRALSTINIGPVYAPVLIIYTPYQGCNGTTTYYSIGGVLVDLYTNCQ